MSPALLPGGRVAISGNMMNRSLPVLLGLFLVTANCLAQKDVLAKANRLELAGQFKAAASELSQAITNTPAAAPERKTLEFELDRLERIKQDFPFTKAELYTELQKAVKGLTSEEFEEWVRQGRFDSREIDGRRLYMGSSVSNLFFRYPELYARRLPPQDTADLEKRHWETCEEIKNAARAEGKPYVLPKRFQMAMSVTAKADAAPAGETLRAWLPIPRDYPFQGDFHVLSSTPAVAHLDNKDRPLRAAYLEQPAVKDKPVEFKLDYEYTMHGVWFDLKPQAIKPPDLNNPALKPFTQEAPHIVFTPELRALSDQIAGTETNSLLKARKFYNWIADNIKYSYAIEYSTIRNISEYCRSHGYGDCGQEALLFMTLCRMNGIPARWQSGWNTFPGAKSIHDWSEIYLAPYGWVPVDPYMGIYAMRYATTLKPEQRRELRDFYFGGLDQYRMIANSDHNQALDPPKKSMRSDDVDFQRGELEAGGHNLYFDQYSYEMKVKELKNPPVVE
jgi:transglutaminase-like putative cysteine protease